MEDLTNVNIEELMKEHENDTVQDAWDSITEQVKTIVSMPEEAFSAENINAVKALILKSMPASLQKDSTNIMYEELVQSGLTREEAQESVEEIKREVEETIDAMGPMSDNKREFARYLYSWVVDPIEEATKLYCSEGKHAVIKVQLLDESAKIPTYANPDDMCADVYSNEAVVLRPGQTRIIHTGLKMAPAPGWDIEIRPRSGMSAKTGLRIANAPGSIDNKYRGELGIIADNIGTEDIHIEKGDRIAQMKPVEHVTCHFVTVDSLDETERGEGGFGSTGK